MVGARVQSIRLNLLMQPPDVNLVILKLWLRLEVIGRVEDHLSVLRNN